MNVNKTRNVQSLAIFIKNTFNNSKWCYITFHKGILAIKPTLKQQTRLGAHFSMIFSQIKCRASVCFSLDRVLMRPVPPLHHVFLLTKYTLKYPPGALNKFLTINHVYFVWKTHVEVFTASCRHYC